MTMHGGESYLSPINLAVDPTGYVVRSIVFDHMSLDW